MACLITPARVIQAHACAWLSKTEPASVKTNVFGQMNSIFHLVLSGLLEDLVERESMKGLQMSTSTFRRHLRLAHQLPKAILYVTVPPLADIHPQEIRDALDVQLHNLAVT
jgi:hypothetical protein